MAGTKCAIGEEQCGFRQGRGCMDQVFAARQVCEKYLANGKDVFWAFYGFGEGLRYDRIDVRIQIRSYRCAHTDTIVSVCAYRYDMHGLRPMLRA